MPTIEIEIEPIPKGRPRFSTKTGHAYTPSRTRSYEAMLRFILSRKVVFLPLAGPVRLTMDFHIRKPKRTRYGQFPPADLDNLIKAVKDAGNGILYNDDKQVVEIIATKQWGDTGRVVLSILPSDG